MSATKADRAQLTLPPVPLTIEGSGVLHQLMRFRWAAWRKLADKERLGLLRELSAGLEPREEEGKSAIYSVLGHKGDLLFLHFRNTLDELSAAELGIDRLAIREYFEPASSYVSVVELGLYESTVKLYRSLGEKGIEPYSADWVRETEEVINRQRQAMMPRLYPKIPSARYICFYPMDRRRGEAANWYTLPIEERQRQMDEHGTVGRRYAGKVHQIISGSIGFDDWEWGVDLFAHDPLQFKKLIYEMRFDEVSAVYAGFGAFLIGIRCPVAKLGSLLAGNTP